MSQPVDLARLEKEAGFRFAIGEMVCIDFTFCAGVLYSVERILFEPETVDE